MSARTPRRGIRLRHASARLWLLVLVLAALATAGYAGVVAGLRPLDAPWHLPWFLLAPLFYLAESHVVHLEVRREAHSFSLGELPMMLALFFGGPTTFVVAQVAGATAAFLFHRRQRPLKVAFNVAHYALEAVVATTVFFVVVDGGDPASPRGWAAALLAAAASAVLGELLVGAAIFLSAERAAVRDLVDGVATGLMITATNASVGLVGVLLLWRDAAAAWLLAVPSAVLLFAYRAYTKDRQKEERIELLRRSTAVMQGAGDVESSLQAFLDHSRQMFRSESACLVLLPKNRDEVAVVTSIGGRGYSFMEPLSAGEAESISELSERRRPQLLTPAHATGSTLLAGMRDGMVAPVFGHNGMIGALLVRNRLGDVSTFDSEDLRLFDTLAQHLGVSLENDRLEESLAEVNEIQKDLEHRATHDALTGLPNRSLFQLRLEQAVAAGAPFALLGIDLDGFKAVNDSFGHDAGDRLLITVGERLEACLRPDDTVARLGGDEFAVLLAGTGTHGDAGAVAQRVVDDLMQAIQLGNRQAFVGASIGIALGGEDGTGAETLMDRADAAMYAAKASGKGRFVPFEDAMLEAKEARARMKDLIEAALAGDQFVLNYQPVVDMADGALWGVEALLRWDHPELGSIAPNDFLPIAEETGQMVRLGEWVLEETCRQMRTWRGRFGPGSVPRVSINLSRRQLLQPGLPSMLAEARATYGLPAGSVVLELNEAALMTDEDAVAARLHELTAAGARLAIDDFGTGFSSIAHLTRLPVDILKIDRSFVRGAHEDPEKSELARAIVGLAAALGLDAVAQGVELPEQRAHLRALGCALGQGYLFARPLGAAAVETLLEGEAPSRCVGT